MYIDVSDNYMYIPDRNVFVKSINLCTYTHETNYQFIMKVK